MITSCRGYIDDCGLSPIWEQDPSQLRSRIDDCIALSNTYQSAYKEVQQIYEEGQNQLNFSEIQVFGDLNDFVTRLEAIMHIMETLVKYGVLESVFFEGKQHGKLSHSRCICVISFSRQINNCTSNCNWWIITTYTH